MVSQIMQITCLANPSLFSCNEVLYRIQMKEMIGGDIYFNYYRGKVHVF